MCFLPFSEVAKMRCCDIIINKIFLSIFVEKSKTEVFQERSWDYLTKLDAGLCPPELVNQYFKKGNISNNCQITSSGVLTPRNYIQN